MEGAECNYGRQSVRDHCGLKRPILHIYTMCLSGVQLQSVLCCATGEDQCLKCVHRANHNRAVSLVISCQMTIVLPKMQNIVDIPILHELVLEIALIACLFQRNVSE
jgi:hypothetical protein